MLGLIPVLPPHIPSYHLQHSDRSLSLSSTGGQLKTNSKYIDSFHCQLSMLKRLREATEQGVRQDHCSHISLGYEESQNNVYYG